MPVKKVAAKQPEASSAYFSYAHVNGWESRKGYIGPGRVVSVSEHLLRIFGCKQGESLYGPEGDRLAGRYKGNGKDWTRPDDCCDWEPAFLSKSKTNQIFAYMIFAVLITGGFLIFLRYSSHQITSHESTTAAVVAALPVQPQAVAQWATSAWPPAAGQFAMAASRMPANATPASGVLSLATPAMAPSFPVFTVGPITVLAGSADAPRAKTFINR